MSVNQIGYPEFTTKLLTDTFDALIASHLRQTEAHAGFLETVSKTLTEYLAETRDDIGGEEILQFLTAVLPADDGSENTTKVVQGNALSEDDATALNSALLITGHGDKNNQVAESGNLGKVRFEKILEAVANRLAANKYQFLQQMVRQGMLRLVVPDGQILTKLNFNSTDLRDIRSSASTYQRAVSDARAQAKSGSFIAKYLGISGSAGQSRLSVSMGSSVTQTLDSSDTAILGQVKISFKTDYQPLDQA